MWIIRDEQLAALELAEQERFVLEAEAAVRQDSPLAASGLDGEELRRRVRIAFARARSHGLEARRDLLAFITMMLTLGPSFDRRLPFSRILALDLPAAVRADMLLRDTHPLEWQRVREEGAAEAWPVDDAPSAEP